MEQEEVEYINSLTPRSRLSLPGLIETKTNFWIKCLIDLLYEADSTEACNMLVYIAINGTEESFSEMIECSHKFKE